MSLLAAFVLSASVGSFFSIRVFRIFFPFHCNFSISQNFLQKFLSVAKLHYTSDAAPSLRRLRLNSVSSIKYKAMRRLASHRTISTFITANMRSYTYESVCSQSGVAMARVLNGKALAKLMNDELCHEVRRWVDAGHLQPSLVCILVGENPASQTYVRNKVKAALEVGIQARTLTLDASITEQELIHNIQKMNEDRSVHGVLVQLPLPDGISERNVCNAVSPCKDVDGFHIQNVGRLCLDMPTLLPATPRGVLELLKRNKIETFGRNAVVVGRSKNVGLPMAMLLHSDGQHESGQGMDATVTICHRYTPREQLRLHCLNADIIITATGVPNLITADMVKPGATVIDVGITRVTDEQGKTRLCGDVDFEEVSKVAGAITPVPGGVGPMTVSMLMHNTLQAAQNITNNTN